MAGLLARRGCGGLAVRRVGGVGRVGRRHEREDDVQRRRAEEGKSVDVPKVHLA